MPWATLPAEGGAAIFLARFLLYPVIPGGMVSTVVLATGLMIGDREFLASGDAGRVLE
jgi:hypothetical protein